jgi:hypothetical protein
MPGAGEKHFMRYVEIGCGNKNMGMWASKNKKTGGRVGFTRWNGQNLLKIKW